MPDSKTGFNPRAREGRDRFVFFFFNLFVKFQSTRPRGARRHGKTRFLICNSFNPRAREGRDACHA